MVLTTHMPQQERVLRDVYLALARAWLVAPAVKDPDLICALVLRTRDLQDRRDLSVVSPEVERSLDRHQESIHRAAATPTTVWHVASGHVVCSRDVIIGACGAADYQAAAAVHNDVMFSLRRREYKPDGRYLLDYWKLEENTLQALCLVAGRPKELWPGYRTEFPWPPMRSVLRDWAEAINEARP